MKYAIVLSLGVLAGCALFRQPTLSPDTPELVSMSTLPVFAARAFAADMVLDAVFHVTSDGTIVGVDFIRSSGDSTWDQAAVDSMKHWRFTPISRSDAAETLLVRSRVIVRVETPSVMALGMLAVSTLREADSLYAQIQRGSDFDALVNSLRWDAAVKRGRYTGTADIGRYPEHVRMKLRRLSVDDVTEPLRVGLEYVIYRRMADGPPGAH